MSMQLWLRGKDEQLFKDVCHIDLSGYGPSDGELLTGELDKPGILGRVYNNFVLGRKRIWMPKETGLGEGLPFVRINGNSAYPSGLILTPYKWIDVRFHLGVRTIDQKTPLDREELAGNEDDDFAVRVFRTYYDTLILKFNERDDHFVLYYNPPDESP